MLQVSQGIRVYFRSKNCKIKLSCVVGMFNKQVFELGCDEAIEPWFLGSFLSQRNLLIFFSFIARCCSQPKQHFSQRYTLRFNGAPSAEDGITGP